MMNDTFSPARMMQMLVKTVRENWRTMSLMVMLVVGTMLLFALIPEFFRVGDDLSYDPGPRSELSSGIWLMFLFGTLGASLMFGNMSDRRRRTSFLMTPASPLEKYLVRWLIFFPAVFVIFIASFFIADWIRVLVFKTLVSGVSFTVEPFSLSNAVNKFDFKKIGEEFTMVFSVYTVACSFFALGSIVWPSRSFIKTFFTGGVITAILITIINITAQLYDTNSNYGYVRSIEVDRLDNLYIWLTIAAIVSITNYVIAYFRFKESEVIERW
ncbi:MAG: hypothetical protein NC098_07555 [Lachnoclostridium sp.]|nr:hypothetical protein [Lachnoclostridium sp.]